MKIQMQELYLTQLTVERTLLFADDDAPFVKRLAGAMEKRGFFYQDGRDRGGWPCRRLASTTRLCSC
jgi:hypothetical protein